MKGIKLGILGITISLLGLASFFNNFTIVCALIGVILAIVGCVVKD